MFEEGVGYALLVMVKVLAIAIAIAIIVLVAIDFGSTWLISLLLGIGLLGVSIASLPRG